MGFDPNGAISGKVAEVLSLLDIPWPGGDPAKLRDLASEWRSAGSQFTRITNGLDNQVKAVVGPDWEGSAADAFASRWATQRQAMRTTAGNFVRVAGQLDGYADEAEEIIKEIVDTALQIAELELGGAVLTFLTAGISDIISNAAAAERAGKIAQLIARFIKLAERAEKAISELLDSIREMGVLQKVMVDSVKNTAMNLAGTQLANAMSGKGWVGVSDLEAAGIGGVGGAVAGAGLDGVGAKWRDANPTSRIASVLDGTDLQGGARIAQQAGAGFVTGAAGTATSDVAQGKDGSTLAWDAAVGGAGGAAGAGIVSGVAESGGGQGDHAKPGPTKVPLPFEMSVNTAVGGHASAMQNAVQNAPDQKVTGNGTDGAVKVPQ